MARIQCHVVHHQQQESFSNGDSVDCTLTLKSTQRVPFDTVEVTLKGICRALQDRDQVGLTTGASTFVQTLEMTREFLAMHIDPEDFARGVLPSPRVLEENEPLSIPFHFTLPDQLLFTNCKCGNAAHYRLPPSIGDHTAPHDDVCSKMMNINYAIHVRLLRFQENDTKVLAQCQHSIFVIPKYPEAPVRPLTASANMRKGIFQQRIGLMLLSADLSSLRLRNHADKLYLQLLTTAQEPPMITSIKAKLHIHNIYSIFVTKDTPSPEEALRNSRISKHTETVSLGSQKMNVPFDGNGQARIVFSVQSPTHKSLPPSFATCHISRQYQISLHVGYSMGSAVFTLPVEVDHPDAPKAEDLPPGFFEDCKVEI